MYNYTVYRQKQRGVTKIVNNLPGKFHGIDWVFSGKKLSNKVFGQFRRSFRVFENVSNYTIFSRIGSFFYTNGTY